MSYGTHLLNHLTTDGTGLTGGQIAVVALCQVNANLRGGLHLETVHCFLCLGYEILVACHNLSPSVFARPAIAACSPNALFFSPAGGSPLCGAPPDFPAIYLQMEPQRIVPFHSCSVRRALLLFCIFVNRI
jgi:hypothetical protein